MVNPFSQNTTKPKGLGQDPNDPSNGTGWNSEQSPWSQPQSLGQLGYQTPPWAGGNAPTGPWGGPPNPNAEMGGSGLPNSPNGASGLPFSPNGPSNPFEQQGAPDQPMSVGGQAPDIAFPQGVEAEPQGTPWSPYGNGPPPEGHAYKGESFLPGEPAPGSWNTDVLPGGINPNPGSFTNAQSAAPQAGQFANNIQGFIDWATQKWGADPTRGSGFINAQAAGGLQNALQAYTQATGNTANFQGGPSGDRVDFGQGVQDALTSGGQIWNGTPQPGGGSAGGVGQNTGFNGAGAYGGGSGAGGITLPSPPPLNQLTAPSPFTYQPSNLGQFQGPAAYQSPSQFSYNGQVPTAQNQQAQQHGDPAQLQYQQYNGMTPEQLASDPSYKFRFDQGANAASNILAHSGALRTGNAAKALTDYGQNAASQEYAAADARARGNVAANNANAYQFGNANINNQFQATQANNSNNLAYGNQNFQNALAAQGQGYGQAANTYGLNTSTQMAAQNQNFNQAATGYGLNQAAQNQGYNQALGAYQTNANTGLSYGAQNQNNALANYQAQVNAALGQGNLNLGFQNSNNSYALGQGNLALGQGQLGLQQQGQNFNQGLQSWQQNYQANVLDPWNMQYQLAQLGNPGAPNGQANANAQSELITGAGNANAAGQVGAQNAWNGWYNNLAQLAASAAATGGTRA